MTSMLAGWPDPVVQVACVVAADLDVEMFVARDRSFGPHGVIDVPLLQRIRDAVPLMGPLGLGPYLEVDTSAPVDVRALVVRIRAAAS
jgi:hypothetical protein